MSDQADTPHLLADRAYDWQRALDITDTRIAQLDENLETERHIRALILAHMGREARSGKAERFDPRYGQRGPE